MSTFLKNPKILLLLIATIIIVFIVVMFNFLKKSSADTADTNVATNNGSELNYPQILQSIARRIEDIKNDFPQLKEFSPIKNTNIDSLVITYKYRTHEAERDGGWTSGVPNPDDDGVWFYIDFHDADSQAQIHTQPVTIPMCLGTKRVQFLMLEGEKTRSIYSEIQAILDEYGVKICG